MRTPDYTAIEQQAFANVTWTAFQSTALVAGGSILLWGMAFSFLRWLI